MNQHVIKYDNVWLQTDEFKTKINWVADVTRASTHSLEWAKTFENDYFHDNKIVEIRTFDEAVQEGRRALARDLKSTWTNRFSDTITGGYEGSFTRDGVDINALMYYSMNISVWEAVQRFVKEFKLTKKQRKTK